MNEKTFDLFWRKNRKHLVKLLKELKPDIENEFIEEGDSLPSIHITISVNESCDSWSYQTGDPSFWGSCYGDPYWGSGNVYRRSNCEELSKELIADLESAIDDWDPE